MARNSKQKTILSDHQLDVLVGTLLGDGWLEKGEPHWQARFGFKQKLANANYVNHVYKVLENLTGTPPKQNQNDFQFKTLSSRTFDFYYNQFYPKGKKRVPSMIHKMLTPRAIAYWFMDDGWNWNGNSNTFVFSTDGFSKADVERLSDLLNTKFSLNTRVRLRAGTNYPRIFVYANCWKTFFDIIDPYILDEFRYKLRHRKA
jgi:hypothetical protein